MDMRQRIKANAVPKERVGKYKKLRAHSVNYSIFSLFSQGTSLYEQAKYTSTFERGILRTRYPFQACDRIRESLPDTPSNTSYPYYYFTMLSGRSASRSSWPVVPVKESTLTPVLTLRGHKDITQSISYFPNGKRIISGSWDKTVREWDIEAGKEIEQARDICKQKVHAVGVSRDGRWVVSAGGEYTGELKVHEVETGTVRIFERHQLTRSINCIDISGDCTLLASGLSDGTIRIWNLETCNLVAGPFGVKSGINWVGAVRFSQDSEKLALRSNGVISNCLEVWDIQSQRLLVYREGNRVPGYGADVPVFWNTKDTSFVTAFSFEIGAEIKTIYEFDVSTLETTGAPFEGHTQTITSIALSLDRALLASAARDNTIKLWALESRQLLASFDSCYTICHLIFSPNSRQLVYTTKDKNGIYLCNTPPEILASLQPVPKDRTISSRNPFPTNSGTLSHTVNRYTSEPPPSAQESLPSYSLPPPSIDFVRRRAGSESWIDRHAETSRIQPTDTRPSTDMWQRPADMQSSPDKMLGQHHKLESQPLHQDTLHSNGGPADLLNTTILPVIVLPPPPRIRSSTVGSRPPQLSSDSRELRPVPHVRVRSQSQMIHMLTSSCRPMLPETYASSVNSPLPLSMRTLFSLIVMMSLTVSLK
ncbi:WD40 repeat-like protein [Suillus hirtellus]|nr:WD40 repeat-like protein [Suillus hirtellus]